MNSKFSVLIQNHTLLKIVFIFVFLIINLSKPHFIQPPVCILAVTCNHTWEPICGQDPRDSSNRLFFDECDMHEFNCDNKRAYARTEVNVCSQGCTRNDQNDAQIDKTEGPTIATSPMSTATNLTSSNNETETTTNSETSIESTTELFETITATDTETGITETIIKTETTDETTDTTTNIAESTTDTETPTTEVNTTETNTDDTETTTEATDTTTDITESTTAMTETTTDTVIPTTDTYNTSQEYTTVTELEEYKETTFTDTAGTSDPTKSTDSTTPLTRFTCNSYPKDCFVPSTWETTPTSETRDFFQVLKARYGDRIKLMRHTTHFPSRVIFQPT